MASSESNLGCILENVLFTGVHANYWGVYEDGGGGLKRGVLFLFFQCFLTVIFSNIFYRCFLKYILPLFFQIFFDRYFFKHFLTVIFSNIFLPLFFKKKLVFIN